MHGVPMLHRDQELAAIADELARLQQGEPAVLLIQGTHGMGRTRLLQAALDRVRGTSAILHARCHEAERDFPFGVVRQLFDPVVGSDEHGAGGQVTAGLAAPGRGGEQDLLYSLYQATRSLAASKSLIIAVDDFTEADPQSAQWFSYIARRLDGLPVGMILAGDADYRGADGVIAELLPLPYVRVVTLPPLCRQCGETLVATVFGEPVDAEFAASCHRVTCGNPLVLLDLCARLRTAGVAPEMAGIDRVAEIGTAALWETMGTRLRLRQPSTVELIECLAILGPDAGLETAAILAGHGELAIEDARDVLGRAGLLTGHPAGRFAYPHLPGTIVARMDPARRSALHGKAVALLSRLGAPPADVAAHVMSIGPTGSPGTVQVLRVAAREAAADQNWAEAARFLRRALAEAVEPQPLIPISADLAAVEMHRDVPSSLQYMRAVVGQARDAHDAAAALAPFTSLLLTLNSATAGNVFAQACQRLVAAGVRPADRMALFRLAAQTMLAGHRTEIRPALAMLTASAPRRHAPAEAAAEDLRSALAITAAAHGRARRRAVDRARRCGDLGSIAEGSDGHLPIVGAALVLSWADRLDDAHALAERQIAQALSRHSAAELALARVARSEIAYRRGDLAASLAAGRAAMGDAAAVGACGLHVAASSCAARVLIEFGDLDDAAALLAGLDLHTSAHPLIWGFHLHVRARLEVARGKLREGLQLLMDAGHQLTAHGITNPACVGWRSRAVLTYAGLGQIAQARQLAAEEIAAARAWGAAATIGRALATASVAHPALVRLDLLREAVEVLDRTGALLEQARAQVRLGVALNGTGADRPAREALHRGLDLATSCGAVTLAARARDHLLAAGARPRGAAGFQPSPLTAGERRVADLVVDGLTNNEVAQNLSISKRTVDTHLAHVYRKLGIRSRSRLGEAVHTLPDRG